MRLDARLCVDKLPCRHATAQLHNRAKGFQYKPLRMQSKMLYEILKGFFGMFNFSSNNLVWISTKEHEKYRAHLMMDTDTRRYYWVYDFKKEMRFEDGLNYCVSGKVNSAEKAIPCGRKHEDKTGQKV